MSGLFDKLQNELDDREEEGGISILDLAELPSQLRKLMRHMLREVEVSFDNLWEHVEGMGEQEKMTKKDLKKALKALAKQGWLITMGEKDKTRYRVNLRRKPGSSLSSSIWSALDDKMERLTKEDPTEGGDS